MGMLFKAPAAVIWFAAGIWGLVICFNIVEDLLGIVVAIIGLFLFPALLGLAPWYALLAQGDWFPLALVYGGGLGAGVLYAIGAAIDRD